MSLTPGTVCVESMGQPPWRNLEQPMGQLPGLSTAGTLKLPSNNDGTENRHHGREYCNRTI